MSSDETPKRRKMIHNYIVGQVMLVKCWPSVGLAPVGAYQGQSSCDCNLCATFNIHQFHYWLCVGCAGEESK